jgi:RecB family exonuclease
VERNADGARHADAVPPRSGLAERERSPRPPLEQAGHAPRRVSPSGLEDFERCPYRYYASHVLRLADPHADRGATEFGTIVHEALRYAVTGTWNDDRRAAVSRRHRMSHEDEARLVEAVQTFDRSELAAALRAHERVLAEAPFAFALGETVLSGRMDVFATSGDEALVVDFKWHAKPASGSGRDDAQRYRRQMGCYALAGFAAGARSVDALVYDVGSGSVSAAWSFGAADAAALDAEARDLVERIAAGGFQPIGSYRHDACVGCPALGGLCPVRPPRRAGGAGRTQR